MQNYIYIFLQSLVIALWILLAITFFFLSFIFSFISFLVYKCSHSEKFYGGRSASMTWWVSDYFLIENVWVLFFCLHYHISLLPLLNFKNKKLCKSYSSYFTSIFSFPLHFTPPTFYSLFFSFSHLLKRIILLYSKLLDQLRLMNFIYSFFISFIYSSFFIW